MMQYKTLHGVFDTWQEVKVYDETGKLVRIYWKANTPNPYGTSRWYVEYRA